MTDASLAVFIECFSYVVSFDLFKPSVWPVSGGPSANGPEVPGRINTSKCYKAEFRKCRLPTQHGSCELTKSDRNSPGSVKPCGCKIGRKLAKFLIRF